MESFHARIDALDGLDPAARALAEERLREDYETELAVLVVDLSGFSVRVRRGGIIPHLRRIRRMQALAVPVVAAAGGELVKCEADNILAVFPDARRAVEAALGIHDALAASPGGPDPDDVLSAGIGIDFGRFLYIPGQDAFGDAVNVAHKLGEDLARAGETLLTDETRRRLGDAPDLTAEPLAFSVSGLELTAHRVARRPG
jgi:class 3 adenylate cyclase